MKYLLFIVILFSSSTLFAQEETEWKEPSKESQAYSTFRTRLSTPPYELAKIKGLLSKTVHDDDENLKLNAKVYNSLSLREKFTYHMIHAEDYSQNCDAMPPTQDAHKKIFGYLPDAFGEYSWSERQYNFMNGNRDSVMALIRESVLRSKKMGVNYKAAIVAVNGWEMIPFLIEFYNSDKKDHDILTLLMFLMKNNEYKPFMTSASFTKLYGEEGNAQTFLDFNKANEALILERANNFYKSKK